MPNTLLDFVLATDPKILAEPLCDPARAWLATVPHLTPERAWEDCADGSWLLTFAVWCGVDRVRVVRAGARCAELALCHVPAAEERPRRAVDACFCWGIGTDLSFEVQGAKDAAAGFGSGQPAARAAADAARWAADAPVWPRSAARAALCTASAFAAAAGADVPLALERAQDALARCADFVRAEIPWDILVDAREQRLARRAA